jgi:hypothetical protein
MAESVIPNKYRQHRTILLREKKAARQTRWTTSNFLGYYSGGTRVNLGRDASCPTKVSRGFPLVAKPEGKRPLGRPRRRLVDNIKMDLKRDRMGWYGLDRSGLG